MTKPDYVLFDKDTTAIIFGNQQAAVQRMLHFDYLAGRDKPSVAAIVNPSGGRSVLWQGRDIAAYVQQA